jgi:hypothetical protein
MGGVLPTCPTPLADGLVRHLDAALTQERLHVAGASRAARGQPDAMTDDVAGQAVVLGACSVSGRSHVGCLSWGSLGP